MLSFLLILVMVVGMLPATSMTALAATAISNVTVTGVTEPKAGSVPTTDGISLGENAEIIPEGTFWSIYNESSAEYITAFDKTAGFVAGKKYGLHVAAKPKDGYAFAGDIKVLYNGNELSNTLTPGNNSFYIYPEGTGEMAGCILIPCSIKTFTYINVC